ncbi:MAG: hypothetical protein K0U98_19530 [Deltaproteobacteria bacterium]|nr:hypothetical protein [Deltaproteobacteria bacterium]
MNTTILHLRQDLARLRWLVAAWLAIVLVRFSSALSNPFTVSDRIDSSLWGLEGILFSAAPALLTILVMLGLSLYRPTAFWPTRPFRRRDLLSSKLAFFGLVFLGPLAIGQILVLSSFGAGWKETFFGLAESLAFETAIVLCIAGLAALAGTLPRTLILLLGIFTLCSALYWPLANLLRFDHHYLGILQEFWLISSRDLGTALVAAVMAAALLIFQFWTRHRKRAVALATVFGLSLLVIHVLWAWPLSRFLVATTTQDEAPHLSIEKPREGYRRHQSGNSNLRFLLSQQILNKVPSATAAELAFSEVNLRYPGLEPIRKTSRGGRFGFHEASARALSLEPEDGTSNHSLELPNLLLYLTPQEFSSIADLRGSLEARGDVRLFRNQISHQIRIEEGTRVSGQGVYILVDKVRILRKQIIVNIQERAVDLTLSPRCCATYWLEIPAVQEQGSKNFFRAEEIGETTRYSRLGHAWFPKGQHRRLGLSFALWEEPHLPKNWLEEARILRVDGYLESYSEVGFTINPFFARDFLR